MNSTEYFEQNDESEQTQTQFISKSTEHSSFYRNIDIDLLIYICINTKFDSQYFKTP